jgi:hypothetical protein
VLTRTKPDFWNRILPLLVSTYSPTKKGSSNLMPSALPSGNLTVRRSTEAIGCAQPENLDVAGQHLQIHGYCAGGLA